jgi:iron complex transport system substrate-binding protein
VKKLHDEGKIKDVGNDRALNYEMVLSLKPNVIFAYGIGAEALSTYARFEDWDIPVVYIGEYLENTPLGKLEWIKFFGCFYDQYSKANGYFTEVQQQYDSIKSGARHYTSKPKVMTGMPWKGVWHVSGGDSFMAAFINDAGAEYLWNNIPGAGGKALALEKIFLDAANADIWLANSMAASLDDITSVDPRLNALKPFSLNKVYNNNKQLNAAGGNNYWESGVVKPHIVLQDLVTLFHTPEKVSTCAYFHKLEKEHEN